MIRALFGVLTVLLCTGNVMGQASRSPFSAFGIGEGYGSATAHSQGMAGVGISNPQYLFINNQNPALLVFNGLGGITSFQAGIIGEQRTVRDANNKNTSNAANLNYLVLAFPIKGNRWVTSVGVMPYTSQRYRFSYTETVNGGSAVFQETGNGGINQVSWSNGIVLHKWLSVGARAGYLFSSIENGFNTTVALTDQTQFFTPNIQQRFNYSGFTFTGAVSLHLDSLFNNLYRLNLGVVYDFKSDIRTDYLQTLVRLSQSGVAISTDTLTTDGTGRTKIPSTLSAGISFGRANQWVFGIDARTSDYSQMVLVENQKSPTTVGWRVAAGFEITPNPGSLASYLKNVTYRTGVSIEEYPYLINGAKLRDFGTNFGISLPVARGCSVDLSGRWGKRGNIDTNTIEEKYFKIYFGVSFNDRWFIKRRFD